MSLHHFTDARLAATDCRRVLRSGARVFVRTGTREQIRSYAYYPFLPASHPVLEAVLPSAATVRVTFEDAGFTLVAANLIWQMMAPNWDAYADRLAANADSILARLAPEDLERGIAAVRQHHARAPGEAVVEPINLFVFRV
jgi:hypothetical protein